MTRSLILIIVLLLATPVWAADPGNRTFDPSLRQLTAELDGMRQLYNAKIESLKIVIDERDKLYSERDKSSHTAVDAALTAVKDQTASAFAANKESVSKYETAQHEYNVRTNEFRGQLEDQAKRLIPRAEVETIVKNLEEKIARLDTDTRINREAITTGMGKGAGMNQLWEYILAGVGLLGSFGMGIYLTRKNKEPTA